VPGAIEDLPELRALGAIAVPDLTPETTWLGQVQRLIFEPSTGSIFAMQPRRGDVVEFSVDGEYLRKFGGTLGEGPGEIRRLLDFALSPTAVALLDVGNQRVLIFDRSARLRSEFRMSHRHRAIGLLGDQIALVPGRDGRAIDLIAADGTHSHSIGLADSLPVRCGQEGCDETDRLCLSCQVVTVNDRVVVVNLDQAIVTAFAPTGDVAWKRDFQSDDPVVSGWVAEDEPVKARMQEEEAARSPSHIRTEVLKSYFLGASVVNDRMILAVVPSSAKLRSHGFELWELDATDGSYERYRYAQTGVGFRATGSPEEGVYALRPADSGIYAFVAGPS
jgi:hypothetical protein